jgi:enamine deaminase RidA (YjgF/YER057c/UK114 family)
MTASFSGLAHAGYVQAAAVHDYAEALCKAAGTSMQKVLRAQYFLSDLAHFPGVAMAWQSRFGAHPLPFLCVQTPPEMPAPGMALIADFWIAAD